ncbi:MAG: glycosyltransferase [Planctomycetota bacterium]|nr:MAG: glycosyltransferase [Planctomycetota bacterium]
MRLLVVYRGLPWPIWEGYHLRVLHLFRRLRRRHEVHLLALIHQEDQLEALAELEAEGVFHSIHPLHLPKRSSWGRLRTNLGLGPVGALKAEYPGFPAMVRDKVESLIKSLNLDVAYVFDTWADIWFSDALLLPTLLDVCDCRSFFYHRRLERGGQSWLGRLRTRQLRFRFRCYERFLMHRYPMATVVSPLDRDYLLGLNPTAQVEIIPNGVDLEMFAPQPQVEEVPDNLIFFGNMDFLPNVDASIHFARQIFPEIRRRRPEASFTVVGSNPLPEVQALAELEGVEVTGRVEDLQPWIARAAMLVAPMRFGAGIKNKILEAMAMEKPVVSNATGVEAMVDEVRSLLQVAQDDQEFADHVVALLENPDRRRELGRRGRLAMAKHHSWDAAAAAYEALFEQLRDRA